jgi:hypothetical protein
VRGIHTQVAELRIELQSRGLPSSGLKAELVERLQAYWADWAEDAGASASTPSPAVPDSGSPRSHPPEATHEATPEEEEDSTPLTPDEEHEEALADAALDYAMSHAPQGHERAFEADGDTREQRATPGGTAGQGTEVERARRQLQWRNSWKFHLARHKQRVRVRQWLHGPKSWISVQEHSGERTKGARRNVK